MFQIQVRPAAAADAAALSALVGGLSLRSALHRFFAGIGTPSPRLVAALLRRDGDHGAWVAAGRDGLLGHAMWGRDGDAAELGVLVADPAQGLGLGRALLAPTLAEAAGSGLTKVRLHVHAENTRLLRRLSRGAHATSFADGVCTITRPLSDLRAWALPAMPHTAVA
ncbi:MAG TPA: GNAT family N-acetyltransferase [Actinomycetes bacterium]|nr:GNAT family N-acetyltransferase [Actinomycetes bacterium]